MLKQNVPGQFHLTVIPIHCTVLMASIVPAFEKSSAEAITVDSRAGADCSKYKEANGHTRESREGNR